MKKKIGITCDDYKKAMFSDVLKREKVEVVAGFKTFTPGTSLITVWGDPAHIKKICQEVENFFLANKKTYN